MRHGLHRIYIDHVHDFPWCKSFYVVDATENLLHQRLVRNAAVICRISEHDDSLLRAHGPGKRDHPAIVQRSFDAKERHVVFVIVFDMQHFGKLEFLLIRPAMLLSRVLRRRASSAFFSTSSLISPTL